jgi:hypothetical protein
VVPDRDGIERYLGRLEGTGVDRVVYVTPDQSRDRDQILAGWHEAARFPTPSGTLEVLVLERTGR